MPETALLPPADPDEPGLGETGQDETDPMDKIYRRRYRLIVWPFRGLALVVFAVLFLALVLMAYLWHYDPDKASEIMATTKFGWDNWFYVLGSAVLIGWFMPSTLMSLPILRKWALGATDFPDEREVANTHRVSHYTLQALTYGALYAWLAAGLVPAWNSWEPELYTLVGIVIAARVVGWLSARWSR